MLAFFVIVTLLHSAIIVRSFQQHHHLRWKSWPTRLHHMAMTKGDGDEPVSPRDRMNKVGLRIGAAAALAVGGKIISDGPIFSESISMVGKTVAITGANTGLGKEAAVKLATLGANVILLCRDLAAADVAKMEIEQRSSSSVDGSGHGRVSCLPLDLASIKSIESCVAQLKSTVPNVDVLMNNAGVMAIPTREVTSDGFERQMGINHLGHFALTALLMKAGLIRATSSGDVARIINVSSAAHFFGDLEKARADDDLLLAKPDAYAPWVAYGNSKLANILFTAELARRLQANSQQNIATFSLHPGTLRVGVCVLSPLFDQPLLPHP
jgi:NAD(P)-dependent dehydrogenase (short-subunit alcohol dehydrogenase family)